MKLFIWRTKLAFVCIDMLKYFDRRPQHKQTLRIVVFTQFRIPTFITNFQTLLSVKLHTNVQQLLEELAHNKARLTSRLYHTWQPILKLKHVLKMDQYHMFTGFAIVCAWCVPASHVVHVSDGYRTCQCRSSDGIPAPYL